MGRARPEGSFTFTPTSYDLLLRATCPPDDPAVVHVRIAGREVGSSSCGGAWSGGTSAAAFWGGFGVAPGRAATVEVTVEDRGGGLVPAGTVRVAAYQRVPLADYPLPPRPATLPTLQPVDEATGWDARRGPAGRTRSVRVDATSDLRVTTVAPGAVRVTVAGRTVGLVESWTWEWQLTEIGLGVAALRAAGVEVSAGQSVDVTVTGERFAEPAWTAVVR